MEIQEVLDLIYNHTKLKLELCERFPGVRKYNGKEYFSVIFNDRLCYSEEYKLLTDFAKKYQLISVTPNGNSRAAIFCNKIYNKNRNQ